MSASAGGVLDASFAPKAPKHDDAEFDITAMIDLVFMMNIYFMVTALAQAMTEIDLPPTERAVAAEREGAVVVTLVVEADGKTAKVFLGDSDSGVPLTKGNIENAVTQAVQDMLPRGQDTVIIKAERRVLHEDVARVARAATAGGEVRLYFAVVEASGS